MYDVGSPFDSYIVTGGWSRDTRDDIIYPTRGRLQSFGVEVGLPFGDVPYYKANYLQQWFTPLPYLSDFVLMLRADLGYADGYSGKPLPFFKAFYAGGVGSVRGYQTASIGPKDIYGNATGGKQKIVGNAELFYPILKGDKSVRASIFYDIGADLRHPARQQHAVQQPRAGLPELSLFGRRRPRVEFADRPAQVQLRLAPQQQAAGQDPAFPVPGRVRILGSRPATQRSRRTP